MFIIFYLRIVYIKDLVILIYNYGSPKSAFILNSILFAKISDSNLQKNSMEIDNYLFQREQGFLLHCYINFHE